MYLKLLRYLLTNVHLVVVVYILSSSEGVIIVLVVVSSSTAVVRVGVVVSTFTFSSWSHVVVVVHAVVY